MRRTFPVWYLTLPVLVSLGCTGALSGLIPGAAQVAGPLVTADPFAPPTGTPFGPLPVTPTPPPTATATPTPPATPTASVPWGYYAAPIEPSAIDVPREMPVIPFGDDVVNFALLGSDARPYVRGHRTDTILIVSLDPTRGTVTLLSVPRDLYIYIPGWRVDRVNVADGRGGPDLVSQTLLYNLGIRIHHWVRINFGGFTSLVDNLGGITVEVGRYYADECGGRWMVFPVGSRRMDGFTALCYVRMRKSGGDFDRLRRQQEALLAIFHKGVSLDALSRLPELHRQFSWMVETDAELGDLLPLVPLGSKVATDPTRIRRFSVDSTMASGWRVPYSGASVLLPNREAILAMLAVAFPP